MKKTKLAFYFLIFATFSAPVYPATVVGSETVLKTVFGVNTHMDNCCNGNYGDTRTVIDEIKYIGARRVRGWAITDAVVNEWYRIYQETGASFHAALPQTSTINQKIALVRIKNWLQLYPGLIDVIEGGNETDTAPAIALGASLAETATLQSSVYSTGSAGKAKITQLSVGAGWAAPLWEGNYKNFGKPPADYGNAHAYMNPGEPPTQNLKRIGALAAYSVNNKPVDVTEFGMFKDRQEDAVTSAYMHQAPFDAWLLGMKGLFVYGLHDDVSQAIGFYDTAGNKRDFADYWHYTTSLLSDPAGKNLPSKFMNINFINQKSTGAAPLGIKNVLMYKSDGSLWIAAYDEERAGAADASQTILLNKKYNRIIIYDARDGSVITTINNTDRFDITMPPNHVYLISITG